MTSYQPGFVSRRQALALALAAGATAALGSRLPRTALADSASRDGTAPTGTLRMVLSVDPDGLDPQRTTAASTFQITNNIYDTLVKVTPEGDLVPGLAESWEVSDDGMSIAFKLRRGVAFSNGDACDAAAVVASFERLKADGSPRAADYANYTVEADGDDVKVTLEKLNVVALPSFAYPWSAVVDVKAADSLKNQPVGTGPFTLKDWTPQQSLTLQANPSYWGDPAKVAEVSLKVMPDATSQVSALRAGELDLASVSADQVASFQGDPTFSVTSQPTNAVQLMAMNLANPALADARVRQAINHAVDKQQLIDTVWWGFGDKIGSHYPVVLKEYVDTNDRYPYDVDAAKKLLADAGYADGLTLEMKLPKSYPDYVSAGQVIADALSKVGVTCNITIVEWASWLSDVYTGRQYDLTVVGHTGRLDPSVLLARYASDSKENYFNYSSAEVDDLLKSYAGERDEGKRTAIVQDIQKTLADDVPAYYIQDPMSTYVSSKKVSGFAVYPIDVYELKDVAVAE